jgi:hypothetical protein
MTMADWATALLQQVFYIAVTFTLEDCVVTATFHCAKGMFALKDALWVYAVARSRGLKGTGTGAADPTTAAAAREVDMATDTLQSAGTYYTKSMETSIKLLSTVIAATPVGQTLSFADILVEAQDHVSDYEADGRHVSDEQMIEFQDTFDICRVLLRCKQNHWEIGGELLLPRSVFLCMSSVYRADRGCACCRQELEVYPPYWQTKESTIRCGRLASRCHVQD